MNPDRLQATQQSTVRITVNSLDLHSVLTVVPVEMSSFHPYLFLSLVPSGVVDSIFWVDRTGTDRLLLYFASGFLVLVLLALFLQSVCSSGGVFWFSSR